MNQCALRLEGLVQAYGTRRVLDQLDLTIQPGEFVALIGPNGSGKTTLLKCLAGIITPQSGTVLVGGVDMTRDAHGAKARLGFAVDPPLLPPLLTGRQCLELFASVRDLPAIPASTLQLADALAFSHWLDREVHSYSLGTRQKLGILLGLIGEPPLIVLDEPMNGLDPLSAFALKQHLVTLTRDHGTAVLLATHALEVAERFISRAVLLIDGRLVRQWDTATLDAIRHDPDASLEQVMVEALAAHGASREA
ncbi:ABC transporter ATP-binding protein [Tahibacter amnicola]|uniref:ABC transporter ATP-binding protein n=1 Tax=Tahibacter amnicola TaxID=2976241 RepID=A0ABY6BFC3_9GAMM|nr:ABC transporter ATP-binding protein [Tahibacter amnicola]UXI67978.1 ABC transporter ATP-binding protein [Tahibacter amnicola]